MTMHAYQQTTWKGDTVPACLRCIYSLLLGMQLNFFGLSRWRPRASHMWIE